MSVGCHVFFALFQCTTYEVNQEKEILDRCASASMLLIKPAKRSVYHWIMNARLGIQGENVLAEDLLFAFVIVDTSHVPDDLEWSVRSVGSSFQDFSKR